MWNDETQIWSFDTSKYRVTFNVMPEPDLDLSWDESGETAAGLANGTYVAFIAHTCVTHKPTGLVLGNDYLGNCVYDSPEDFCTGANRSGYFRDMVRNAITEARFTLARLRA